MTDVPKSERLVSSETSTYFSALDALKSFSTLASSYRSFVEEVGESTFVEPPRIVYIFDSNICLSFLRPREHVFLEAAGVSKLFSRGRQGAVERMTVRYLFEGRLPGQDGEPIFLAPAHWNELLNQTGRFFHEKGRKAAKLEDQVTEDKIAELRSVEHDSQKLVQLAEKLGIARAMQELGDALELARRVEILFGESDEVGRIRGLDQATSTDLFRTWNDARRQVSWRTENDWRRAISEAKRNSLKDRLHGMSASARDAELERLTRATVADASSLALVETLFLVDALAGGESPQRQYVFVTSDTAILEASIAQRARLEENGVPVFVHSPALFFPLADYQHFHDAITTGPDVSVESSETSDKIFEAISSLYHAPQGRSETALKPIRALRENWNYTADLLTLIGNEKFVDDFTDQSSEQKVKRTYDLLAYKNIGVAIEQTLQQKMENVSRRHGRVSIEFSLELLPERFKVPKDGTSDPRAPVHFLAVDVLEPLRQAGATECTSWPAFVKEMLESAAAETSRIQEVSDTLLRHWSVSQGQVPSPTVLLLTATLLSSAGLWHEALKCANWAATAARKKHRRDRSNARRHKGRNRRPSINPIAIEANYISALSQRMLLRNSQQFNSAKDRLSDNIQVRSSERSLSLLHRFAYFRDSIEKSSLILTAAVVQCIEAQSLNENLDEFHTERFFQEEDLADAYQGAIEALEVVVDDLDSGYLGTGGAEENQRLVVGLMLRARTNILGAEINRHFIPSLQPETGSLNLVAEAAREISRFKNEMKDSIERTRLSQEIYVWAAEFMTGESSSKQGFDDLMRSFEIVLSENASTPDRIEMENLEACIRGLAENRGLLGMSRPVLKL